MIWGLSSLLKTNRWNSLNEKILFADILSKKFEGKILDSGNTLQGLTYVNITNPPGIFKHYKHIQDQDMSYLGYAGFNKKNINLIPVTLYAKSLEGFIEVSDEYELKYISINKNNIQTRYSYLNEIYENEESFPYLGKVFDTEEEGFEKFKTKVFEIDYEKFYLIKNKE